MCQAAGACWYLLGIQRASKCLKEQCRATNSCGLRILSCREPIYYGTTRMVSDRATVAWAENKQARSKCLENSQNYDYGAYQWTVQLVTNDSRLEKILFPIFWGLMTLRYYSFAPFFYYYILLYYFNRLDLCLVEISTRHIQIRTCVQIWTCLVGTSTRHKPDS